MTDYQALWDSQPSREEIDDWLLAQEEEIVALINRRLVEIVDDAYERFLGTLTASGDLSAFDSVPEAWGSFVTTDLGDRLGGIYLGGSASAWIQAPGTSALPRQTAEAWAQLTNQRAVDYIEKATSRLTGEVSATTWNEIRNKVSQAISTGASTQDLRDQIDAVTGFGQRRAAVIARTEINGAYLAGTYEGAEALGEYGPVEKYWIASPGPRTRATHAAADNGETIPFDQPFVVGGADMMRPHDPAGPAKEVVNCRCRLGLLYPGQERPDGSIVGDTPGTQEIESSMPSGRNRNWADSVRGDMDEARRLADEDRLLGDSKRPVSTAVDGPGRTNPKAPMYQKENDSVHFQLTDRGKALNEKIRKIGGEGLDEVNRRQPRLQEMRAELEPLQRARAIADADSKRIMSEMEDIKKPVFDGLAKERYGKTYKSLKADQKRRIESMIDEYEIPGYEEARRRYLESISRSVEASRAINKIGREYIPLLRETILEVIADARPLAQADDIGWANITQQGSINSTAVAVREAMKVYPQEWVVEGGQKLPIVARKASARGHFTQIRKDGRWIGEVVTDSRHVLVEIVNDEYQVAVHELGHYMEATNPRVRVAEHTFYWDRVGSETVQRYGSSSTEFARADEFFELYCGKPYGQGTSASSFELFQMGTQALLTGSQYGMAIDEDYIRWTIGVLVGL